MKPILPLLKGTNWIGRFSIMLVITVVAVCGPLAYAKTGHKSGSYRNASLAGPPASSHAVTHPSRLAKQAAIGNSHLASGTFAESNGSKLYVAEETTHTLSEPLLCLTEVETSGVESHVCGPSSEVERYGLIAENVTSTPSGTHMRVDILMPSGITNLTEIGNHGNEEHAVRLQDNVAETELENVEFVRYTLSDGTVRTVALLHGDSKQP